MPDFEAFYAEDPTAFRIQVRRADGRTVVVVITKALESSTALGEPSRQLLEAVTNAATSATAQKADLSDEGFDKRWREFTGTVPGKYQPVRDAGISQSRALDSWRDDLVSAKPTIPPNATESDKLRLTLAAELRQSQVATWLNSMKPSEMFGAALGNRDVGATILATPVLRGRLPADLVERLTDDVIEQTLIKRFATANSLKPNIADPLAYGTDLDAAKSMAREAMAAHKLARDEIASLKTALKSTAEFVAILGNVSRDEAFAFLNG